MSDNKSKKNKITAKASLKSDDKNKIETSKTEVESNQKNVNSNSNNTNSKATNNQSKEEATSNMQYPDLTQFNEIFQNNIKIYNNLISSNFSNFGKGSGDSAKTADGEFGIQDLLKSINPTTSKIMESLEKFTSEIGKNPTVYYDNIGKWLTQLTALNFYFVSRLSNQNATPPIKEDKTDKRFSSNEWQQNLFFDFIKQFYLITYQMLDNLVESVQFPDPKQKALMQFYIKQLNMAMSPSNFVFTNPDVMLATFKENGENLVRGYNNFREDYLKHPNKFFISQTKFSDFKVGENLATTPGKVIFKNEVFELIHYKPETETQFEKPLLIVPPFINKFYIMDLNEKKINDEIFS